MICEGDLAQRSVGHHRPLPLYLETSKSCLGGVSCISDLSEAADRWCRITSVILVVAGSDYDAIMSLIWYAVDWSQSCRRQYFAPGVARSQAR